VKIDAMKTNFLVGANEILPKLFTFFVRRGQNSALEMMATVCPGALERTKLPSVIFTVLLRREFRESRHKEGRSFLMRCVSARGQEAAARFKPRATKTKHSLLRR
jgi:hypothetical protein